MSFTRIQYDECAYNEKINNSQKPMYYKLFKGQAEQCDPCVSSLGPRNFRTYNNSEITKVKQEYPLDMALMTDVDSLLSNRGYPNARCMTGRTLKEKDEKIKQIPLGAHAKECDKSHRPEYTRLNIPTDNFRGIYIDRWEEPIIDPVNWLGPFNPDGRNSKLVVRDSFKPFKPTPMKETALPETLPEPQNVIGLLKTPYNTPVNYKIGVNTVNKKIF
jgi:hypothetical protein